MFTLICIAFDTTVDKAILDPLFNGVDETKWWLPVRVLSLYWGLTHTDVCDTTKKKNSKRRAFEDGSLGQHKGNIR